jgi:transcriptional regulator with XRE-family HTH domain
LNNETKMEPSLFGNIIKQLLKKNGISVIEFAHALETSRENVYTMFRRDSFSSELLWKMSLILKQNLFKYYADMLDKEHGRKLQSPIDLQEESEREATFNLALLQKENISLKREIELLREINGLLKAQVNQ